MVRESSESAYPERLMIPVTGEGVHNFERDLALVPPQMASEIDGLMSQFLTMRKGRKKNQLQATIEDYLDLSREMLGLFESPTRMPIYIENLSNRWADMVDKIPVKNAEQREETAEKWFGNLEQGIKAAQTVSMVKIARGLWKKRITKQVLPSEADAISPDLTAEIARFAYDVQNDVIPHTREGYREFARRYTGFLSRETLPMGSVETWLEEHDPLLIPWTWMTLSGEAGEYQKAFTERITENASILPTIVVGIATENLVESGDTLAVRPSTLLEEFADIQYPLGNYPVWIKNRVTPIHQRGIRYQRGDELAFNLADERTLDRNKRTYLLSQLETLSADEMIDDHEMNENFGYEKPAVLLSINVNLVQEVMGKDSTWAHWMQEIATLNEQKSGLSVPVGLDEAKAFLEWTVPEGMSKERILRQALMFAHIHRFAGTAEAHGFGALLKIFKTQFWATMMYNLRLPGHDGSQYTVTGPILERLSTEITDENRLALIIGKLLSERVTGVSLTVLGADKTGATTDTLPLQERSASSMQNSSYAVTEAIRAWCLLEQGDVAKKTALYGHSKSGQVILRALLLLPTSTRRWLHSISATPVATSARKAMTFLNTRTNKITPLLINLLAGEENSLKQNFGKLVSFLGDRTGIKQGKLKLFTYPTAKSDLDYRYGRQLFNVHNSTLSAFAAILKEQMSVIGNKGDVHKIEEILKAAGIKGGGDATVLIGRKDPVLHPGRTWKAIKKACRKFVRPVEPYTMEDPEIKAWVRGRGHQDGPGKPLEVVFGDISHYPETTSEGRWLLRFMFMRALGIRTYGYRKEDGTARAIDSRLHDEARELLHAERLANQAVLRRSGQ